MRPCFAGLALLVLASVVFCLPATATPISSCISSTDCSIFELSQPFVLPFEAFSDDVVLRVVVFDAIGHLPCRGGPAAQCR
jgi:hypothetical protein